MAKLERIRVLGFAFGSYDVRFERIAVLNDDGERVSAIVLGERGERIEESVFAVDEETNGGFVDDAVEGAKNGEDCGGRNGEAELHSEIGEEGDVETESRGRLIGLDLIQDERNDFVGEDSVVEPSDQKRLRIQTLHSKYRSISRESHSRERRHCSQCTAGFDIRTAAGDTSATEPSTADPAAHPPSSCAPFYTAPSRR